MAVKKKKKHKQPDPTPKPKRKNKRTLKRVARKTTQFDANVDKLVAKQNQEIPVFFASTHFLINDEG